MKIIRAFICLICVSMPMLSHASDLERLAKKGYGVIETTQVDGEFNGCEFGKKIPLMDGLIFSCATYSFHYGYSPEVLILKNVRGSDLKVIIDDEEFDGTLFTRR